ncbi:MAG: hypothetical protein V3U16_07585 [Candidatus Neomarinimicrobiota bacterium]
MSNKKTKKTIHRSRTAEMFLDEDGIIHQTHAPDSELTLEDIQEELVLYQRFAKREDAYILIDLGNVKSVTLKARMYLASNAVSKFCSGAALIAPSLTSKVLGNFFLGLNKPVIPTKLFGSEEEGLKWLRHLKQGL